jgi:hypothetical protein
MAGDRRVSSAGSRVPSAGSSSSGRDGSASTGPVPCKVWVGAADGSLSVCSDVTGSGVLEPAGWRVLRVEGLTGGCWWYCHRRCRCNALTAVVILAATARASLVRQAHRAIATIRRKMSANRVRTACARSALVVLHCCCAQQQVATAAATAARKRLPSLAPAHLFLASPSIPVTQSHP